jgi:hypothetical protein
MCPHLVKNSNQAIAHFHSHEFPPSMILVASDVVRMYPTIQIEDAIDSLSKYLDFYERNFEKTIVYKSLIVNIARIVLMNNFLYFTILPTIETPIRITRHFYQQKGLPIGSSCATVIANIFMCMTELRAQALALNSHIPLPLSIFEF